MKNRNIPYYMAVLALAAGMSTSFVSCVDTEEPESITELRKAKAEEVRAEAKVQEALAGLKDAEAAYKKAEERAKIADAVTTELANKLTEAKNNLEIAKLTAKNDIEISTAKEEAQAALDEAKNKAAVALEGYAVSLEEAKLAAKVALAEIKANGVTPKGGKQGDLLTALEEYNAKVKAVETATKTLKKAVNNLTTGPAAEKELQDKVDEESDKLKGLEDAQKEFTELAQNADIQALLDAYKLHKANLEGTDEAKKNYEYQIKDYEEQISAITKPSKDALKTYQEKKEKDYAFDVPESLQEDFDKLADNDKSVLKYDTDKKQLVLKSEEGVENSKLKDGVQAALDILSTKYLNAIKQASDRESTADKKKKYDDKVKTVESNEDSYWKKWDAAVKAYQKTDGHTDANLTALENATEAYFGSKYPLGADVLILVKPSIENLLAYYGEEKGKENDKTSNTYKIYYAATTEFGQLNTLYKEWQDSKKADDANTLKNAIDAAVTAVTDKIAELEKAVETAKADEKIATLEKGKADVEKKKAEYEASLVADEALVKKIEGFTSLKYLGVKIDKTDPKNVKYSTEDVTFSEENLSKYLKNFEDDLAEAKASFEEDITTAKADLKAAEDQLAAFKKAVAAQNFDEYYYDYVKDGYISKIVAAQAELETANTELAKAKAKYDLLVEAYK